MVEPNDGHYRWDGTCLRLRCLIQPRASRNEIIGIHDNRLKIRLTSPPVDGLANARLLSFLAKEFGVTKTQVVLTSGDTSRRKVVSLDNPRQFPRQALIQRPDLNS